MIDVRECFKFDEYDQLYMVVEHFRKLKLNSDIACSF